ncbi:MAG TPA: thiol protease/hemagglutinin PrtT [Chitinophagales bacterium]|nr:thiol protease/hemagglutinin PrtT [Chitinophagales bacterium]
MTNILSKFIIVLGIGLLSFTQITVAQTVSIESARKVAANYYSTQSHAHSVIESSDAELIETKFNGNEILYYVFSIREHTGFIIVAADYAAMPILAFSDESNYTTELSQNVVGFAYLMDGYAKELLSIKNEQMRPTQYINTQWQNWENNVHISSSVRSSVLPLISTTWDQGGYYDDACPGGSVTGCVATAMAQVMKYWNYPPQGVGSHCYNENNYGNLCANFGATTYNWGAMPNNVTAPNSSVATLMYHCGVSVDMDYSPTGSAANVSTNARNAFKDYFGYDTNITYVQRSSYSEADWLATLKSQLDVGRPMIYRGEGSSGGHAWVCDGYNSSNLFHMNWGWGGYLDGYFSINGLNPGSSNFNTGQGALANIIPGTSCPTTRNLTAAVANGDYEASSTIIASNTVSAGQDVEYDASVSITLQPGFWAQSGTTFHAVIEGCGGMYMPPPNGGDVANNQTEAQSSNIAIAPNAIRQIFPNPIGTNETLHLQSEQAIQRIELFDMTGRLVYNEDLANNVYNHTLQVPVVNGVYLLLLSTDTGIVRQKIVVQ